MTDLTKQHFDASDILRTPNAQHDHKLNQGVDPGISERSDFEPGGPAVPRRPSRALVDPTIANDDRRKPSLGDVTVIASGSGNSHIAEPPPSRL
jgi:hypothetical protein